MSTETQLGRNSGMQAGLQHQLLPDLTTLSLLSQCPQPPPHHQQPPNPQQQQAQDRHVNDRITTNGTLPHGTTGKIVSHVIINILENLCNEEFFNNLNFMTRTNY